MLTLQTDPVFFRIPGLHILTLLAWNLLTIERDAKAARYRCDGDVTQGQPYQLTVYTPQSFSFEMVSVVT